MRRVTEIFYPFFLIVSFSVALFCLLLLIACKPPPPSEANVFRRDKIYPQSFKSDSAWIVLERNGRVYGYGSGFLADKERGAFYTNKHVSDMFNTLGRDSHKIFFNGRVYNAEVVKTPPLIDAALVCIVDSFDFSEFPEPAPVSKTKTKIGDTVVIQGFHPHPFFVRTVDKAMGHEFPLVPIFRTYYDMDTRFADKEIEVVFETIPAKITELNAKLEFEVDPSDIVGGARNRSNRYIKVETLKDHLFPFGGLSGSAVRNADGEIIGILTAGPSMEFDPEPDEQGFLNRVFKTVYLTPIEEVEILRKYLPNK